MKRKGVLCDCHLGRHFRACMQIVTVDSCYYSNKIKVKKLVVLTLICHLALETTWGQPYPVHAASPCLL